MKSLYNILLCKWQVAVEARGLQWLPALLHGLCVKTPEAPAGRLP